MSTDAAAPQPEGPTPAECKRALQAFKKRLKLMKLDDESRMGGRQMSGGFKSGIVAISPPDQYPRAVWDELVKQKRLKTNGNGLYELVQP